MTQKTKKKKGENQWNNKLVIHKDQQKSYSFHKSDQGKESTYSTPITNMSNKKMELLESPLASKDNKRILYLISSQ